MPFARSKWNKVKSGLFIIAAATITVFSGLNYADNHHELKLLDEISARQGGIVSAQKPSLTFSLKELAGELKRLAEQLCSGVPEAQTAAEKLEEEVKLLNGVAQSTRTAQVDRLLVRPRILHLQGVVSEATAIAIEEAKTTERAHAIDRIVTDINHTFDSALDAAEEDGTVTESDLKIADALAEVAKLLMKLCH